MYCKKCGNVVDDGEQFCAKCGSEIEYSNMNMTEKVSAVQSETHILSSDGGSKYTSVIINILLVICGILILVPTFNAGMWGMGMSMNIFEMIEIESLKYVAILMYVISIVCAVLPSIKKRTPTLLNIIPALVTNVLVLLLFVVSLILGSGSANQYGVKLSLTAAGWFEIILTACSIALIIIRIKHSK